MMAALVSDADSVETLKIFESQLSRRDNQVTTVQNVGLLKMACLKTVAEILAGAVFENGAADRALICRSAPQDPSKSAIILECFELFNIAMHVAGQASRASQG